MFINLVRFALYFCGVAITVFFRRLFSGPKHPSWSLPYEVATSLMAGMFQRGLVPLSTGKPYFQPATPLPMRLSSKLRHKKDRWAGLPAEIHVPRDWDSTRGATLLYLHGGGYIGCHPGTHRELVARLSLAANCRAIAPEYRKAPAYPYPAALDDALAAYTALRAEGVPPERIFVGGDSAGGGLALALCLSLRERGLPQPRALVLLSPWVDLEGTGASMQDNRRYDYLSRNLTDAGSKLYAGERSLRDPMLSPIHAELRGLPEMIVHNGALELFASEDALFVERVREAGISVEHRVWDNQVHVFQAFAMVSHDARASIDALGQFVRARALGAATSHPTAALPGEVEDARVALG